MYFVSIMKISGFWKTDFERAASESYSGHGGGATPACEWVRTRPSDLVYLQLCSSSTDHPRPPTIRPCFPYFIFMKTLQFMNGLGVVVWTGLDMLKVRFVKIII